MLQASMRNKYMENSVQTATPAQLLIMLYDGAIRFCKLGAEAIRNKDYAAANLNLCKAQAIVNEFIASLDNTSEVASGLLPLYEYMNSQLIAANLQKNIEPIDEVLGYLVDLKETWVQATRQLNAAQIKVPQHG